MPKNYIMKKGIDIEKLIACVAYICGSAPDGKYRAIDMIKAMYMAERESVIRTFHPMTGDDMMCYVHGPILKTLHDLTRGCARREYQSQWDKCFTTLKNGRYNVIQIKLAARPNMDRLSPANEAFLNRGIGFVDSCNGKSIIHETHKSMICPEWVAARNAGLKNIRISDILKRYRKDLTRGDIEQIQKEIG